MTIKRKRCPKRNLLRINSKEISETIRTEDYRQSSENKRKENYSQRKLEILEKEIEEMEDKLRFLVEEINVHNSEVEYLQELFLKKEKVENELNMAYDIWESSQL
ncbi:MAG: hypothetical protein WCD89_16995 [Anaerocolumna sp.]